MSNQQPTPWNDQLGVRVLDAIEVDRQDYLDQLFWAAQGELESEEPSAPHPKMDRWFQYWGGDVKALVTQALEGTAGEVIDGDMDAWIPFRVRRRGGAGPGEPLRLVIVGSEPWLVDVSNTRDNLIDIVNAADPAYIAPPPGPADPDSDDF